MPNRTIYINKANWELLEPEDNKSNIINELLNKYYREMTEKVSQKVEDFATVGIRTEIKSDLVQQDNGDYKATMTIVPNEEDVAAYKEKVGINCPRHHVPKSDCIAQHK